MTKKWWGGLGKGPLTRLEGNIYIIHTGERQRKGDYMVTFVLIKINHNNILILTINQKHVKFKPVHT